MRTVRALFGEVGDGLLAWFIRSTKWMGGSQFTVRAGSHRVYWMNCHWPRIFCLAGFILKVHCEKQAEWQAMP
jgi:hypothetical protein